MRYIETGNSAKELRYNEGDVLRIINYREKSIIQEPQVDSDSNPLSTEDSSFMFTNEISSENVVSKLVALQGAARARIENLTKREQEVLGHLAKGATNKEIAKVLGISPRTVEIHRSNLFRRLGAASVADAVRILVYKELPL